MEHKQFSDSCGYLYIATGAKYLKEVSVSAKSLKRFTQKPICVVTDDESFQSEYIDQVIIMQPSTDFVTKIIGVQLTPFQRTIFLDSDTFVCSPLDQLFEALDLFDMSMSVDNFMHSLSFFQQYNPSFEIKYKNVIPEYNTGVIVYKNTSNVQLLFADWLRIHTTMQIKADMPSFRETFLQHAYNIRIAPLPFEYNFHGVQTFGFAYNEIKVIHERLGEKWNTLTSLGMSFDAMDRFAKKINKNKGKRIIVHTWFVIPYTFSPFRLKYKLKKMLGIKKTKKSETY
jgi:lipopolysaccharide biosynthesis glycosyltransferase